MRVFPICLVMLAAAGLAAATFTAEEAHQIFQAWKAAEQKEYASVEEETYRQQVFADNLLRIERLNQEQPDATFGPNKFADLSPDEFAALNLAYREPEQTEPASTRARNMIMAPAPEAYDWTTAGILNAVRDQGSCGAQWAFSAIASIESQYARVAGKLYSLSEQQLIDCDSSN